MKDKTIIITGEAGFIGSRVVRRFVKTYPDYKVVNLDKLTYAGNLTNLADIERKPNYRLVKDDAADSTFTNKFISRGQPDGTAHLAAESHVDCSINSPTEFVITNVIGIVNLFNATSTIENKPMRFYHVSTDEAHGVRGDTGMFTETTSCAPHSPYSYSKVSSDHFVWTYYDNYDMDVVISNSSNNYGSHHFQEKLMPLSIHNIQNNKAITIYGKGENIRDWLWVEEHARVIDLICHKAASSKTYNIGGHNEWTNIDLIRLLCNIMVRKLGRPAGESEKLITFVKDRTGHDLRCSIDATKLEAELGWKSSLQFEEGLEKSVDWYLQNEEWLANVTSGEYQDYYEQQY